MITPRAIGPEELQQLTARLAAAVRAERPEVVVYIERGGEPVGRGIAATLGIPAQGLAVRYPASPVLERLPATLRTALWPLKELLYRAAPPQTAATAVPPSLPARARMLLVDDTASSGRTLDLALRVLADAGHPRERVVTAVIRCGSRARPVVDFHLLEERVRISPRRR